MTSEWKFNQTLASTLGIANVSRIRVSQAPDTLTFDMPGKSFDADPLFAYGSTVTVHKDTTQIFKGRVISIPRTGSPQEENQQCTLAGPWWYLDHLIFQQEWTGSAGNYNKSRVILGRTRLGVRQTTGAVIKEVLDYAIATGAPLNYSASELLALDITPPTDEQLDLACAEAIIKMLRWHIDVSTWFDYSLDTPDLHFTKRANATPISYALTGDPAQQFNIIRRDDLKISGIVIKYEITSDIQGVQRVTIQEDTAGSTSGFDVLTMTVPLEGFSQQWIYQTITAEVVPVRNEAFWEKYELWLKNVTIDSLDNDADPAALAQHPRELKEGQIQKWMTKTSVKATFTATVKYTDENGSIETKKISATLTLTDAMAASAPGYTEHTYWKLSSYVSGEDIPEDLAAKLYAVLNQNQYQGSLVIINDEIPADISPGNVLNLTGGISEWSTMQAHIQQIEQNIDQGRTIITFGPPEHLAVQDYIELLRANRTSRTAWSLYIRKDDKASAGNASGDESKTGKAKRNSSGGGTTEKLVVQV